MTEQKEKNSESTHSATKLESMDQAAYQLVLSYLGRHEIKDSEKPLLEKTSRFLKDVEKYGSILPATVIVTLTQRKLRTYSFWRLHKNTRLLSIIVVPAPTNNNTHTPAAETVTS